MHDGLPQTLGILCNQLVGQLNVLLLGLVLAQTFLLIPYVPLGLALKVQHARLA